jgi:hypothetical protein
MRATKWLQTPTTPATSVGVQVDGPGSPSQTTLPADRLKEIQAAVEASPSKIAVIFVRDHQVPGPSMNASNFKFADGSRSWDHVAIAWMDANGNLVFAEARPVNGAAGVVLFGKNSPGTATQLVTEYKDFKVVPIDLGRYGPGARDAFVNAVTAATGPGSFYSLTNKNIGTVCSAAIQKGLDAAYDAHKPLPGWVQKLKASLERFWLLGVNQLNLYIPKTAYLDVAKHAVRFRFDPKAPLVKREWSVVGQPKIVVVETNETETNQSNLILPLAFNTLDQRSSSLRTNALGAPSLELSSAALALQSATGQGTQTSQQELQDQSDDEDDEDDEDALTDDGPQQPGTHDDDDEDDDEDALEQEVILASDPEHTPPHDPAHPPEIDDDEDEDELTLVSDPEDARTDGQQPAIDDDDEEQADDEDEELEDASDPQDAPTADALMETAKAEAGADATADDQPGHQLATSVPVTADDGFSFSLFPKPGVPTEVAKEAMPAEQPSPEAIPGSGVPGSESAHPDLDSANVGNAAPNHERVVHHGDLAP